MQKITSNIKVPNKDLEVLKKHFPHYFDKNGNFDFEKFKNYLTEKEINFSIESYGLEWLGKSYARLLATDPATTLLKADETHNSKAENRNAQNLLIKGDNLEVLKHLANAYYEKIKMIYIDPPYNTGSDGFVYNDDRKYTVKELQNLLGIDEEKAQRILDFTQSKSNSHSAWLTFMYPRLYIARQLLREDGVIFVSIDDNEVAQLRLLMDEIFGEENFIENYIWHSNFRPDNSSSIERENAQHVLCYSRNKQNIKKLIGQQKQTQGLPSLTKNKPGTQISRLSFKKEWIETNLPDGIYKAGKLNSGYILHNDVIVSNGKVQNDFDLSGKVIWSQSYLEDEIKKGTKIVIKTKDFIPYSKKIETSDLAPTTLIPDNEVGDVLAGNSDINELFQAKVFEHPKPVSLLKYLLYSINDEFALILDFFAGSGTTGDAVMQLNAEDGGNRKFILVQLPEPIDPKKNKTAYDFVKNELGVENPTIFEITKERLLRAAKKIKEETINKKIAEKEKQIKDLESQLDLENNEEQIAQLKKEIQTLQNQDLGFKIFETMPIWEDYDFEAEQFDPSQTLFDTGKLTDEDIKALLTTWKTYDGIALTQDLESVDLGGYTAYYGHGKLYLMHKGFTTDHLKALLEKVDTDKHFDPKTIIAFGYHFESARLRELAENVKTYNNKKKTDIDFIIRY